MAFRGIATILACAALGSGPVWAINGASMALRSNGVSSGVAWRLNDSGYVGTYVSLASPGEIIVSVNARGLTAANPERMNVVIGDERVGWNVTTASTTYQHTFQLPAGTHFVRTEYANGPTTSALIVNSVDVAGAAVLNANNGANALAAANSYIATYRQGNATVQLPAAWAGAEVQVKLRNHAFNYGAAVPNSFNGSLLVPNPAPNSDAARFQQALRDSRINSLTAENAGKWDANEQTRDVLTSNVSNPNGGPNIPYIDRISDFAAANDMRYRAHNVIWGPNSSGNNNQQPTWVHNMLQNPAAIDAATGQPNSVALREEVSERIGYYVQDRAQRFAEVDVYNESYHTGSNLPGSINSYWSLYGVNGIASIYKEANDAIAAAGADARAFVNEYNAFNNEAGDYYANWYARHVEAIQTAGQTLYGEDVVGGIGVQYYNGGTADSHNAARSYAALHNLAVQGLPMSLTEWGVTGGTETNAANILADTATLVFGTPETTGFTHWNIRATPGAFAPVGSLYNNDWSLRETGVRWQQLMAEWDTDLATTVGPDGTVDFRGFFGDYDVTLGGETYSLSLVKGIDQYELSPALPIVADFDFSGVVDGGDLAVWAANYGTLEATFGVGDATGDGVVDGADFLVWQRARGGSAGTPAANAIPEPGAIGLLGLALALVAGRRTRRDRRAG